MLRWLGYIILPIVFSCSALDGGTHGGNPELLLEKPDPKIRDMRVIFQGEDSRTGHNRQPPTNGITNITPIQNQDGVRICVGQLNFYAGENNTPVFVAEIDPVFFALERFDKVLADIVVSDEVKDSNRLIVSLGSHCATGESIRITRAGQVYSTNERINLEYDLRNQISSSLLPTDSYELLLESLDLLTRAATINQSSEIKSTLEALPLYEGSLRLSQGN